MMTCKVISAGHVLLLLNLAGREACGPKQTRPEAMRSAKGAEHCTSSEAWQQQPVMSSISGKIDAVQEGMCEYLGDEQA